MNQNHFFKSLGSFAALGFIIAVVAAVLYFMQLPIFNQIDLAWIFFYGLIAFALAIFFIVVRGIWDS